MAVASGYGKHFKDVSSPEFDQTMKVRKLFQTRYSVQPSNVY